MSPALRTARAVLALVAVPGLAQAQENLVTYKFRTTIQAACALAPGLAPYPKAPGAVEEAKVRAALLDKDVALPTSDPVLLARPASGPPAKLLAQRVFEEIETNDPNSAVYYALKGYARSWVTPDDNWPTVEEGSVEAQTPAGQAATDPVDVLESVLGNQGRYIYRCQPRTPANQIAAGSGESRGATATVKKPYRWALARTPSDLAKGAPTALKSPEDKSYAEFAFSDDEVKDLETYAINASLGVVFAEQRRQSETFASSASGLVFVEAQRQGASRGTEGYVNNLNFGLGLSGYLAPGPIGATRFYYYDLAAKYLTDDDFHSRAYGASLKVGLPIELPGYRVAAELPGAAFAAERVYAWWGLAGVADWVQVDAPGEKTKLATAPEFFRLGYDLDGHLLWTPRDPRRKFAIQLDAAYAVRDGQSEDGGDAQLVTAAIRFLPDPRLSVGLSYERGENLDSLERIDIVKFVVGARF